MFSYCLVVAKKKNIPRILDVDEEKLTGLYGWLKAFKGDIVCIDDLDKNSISHYDIVHVNMITLHADLPSKLRQLIGKSSSTKLIANLDYSVEMMPQLFGFKRYNLGKMADSLRECDLIFCQEPKQKDLLEFLTKREVHLIEHPTNIRFVKSFYKYDFEKEDKIAVMHHKCHPDSTLWAWLITDQIKGMKKALYAFRLLSNRLLYGRFDEIYPALPFGQFLDKVSSCKIALDSYQMHVYGRFVVDMAVLGIPVVGSSYIAAMKRLFPKLMFNPFNIDQARAKIYKLLKDKKFYNETKNYAEEKVEYYSIENKRRQLLEALGL